MSSNNHESSLSATPTRLRRYGWYAVGAYSATLVAALIWRRWKRRHATTSASPSPTPTTITAIGTTITVVTSRSAAPSPSPSPSVSTDVSSTTSIVNINGSLCSNSSSGRGIEDEGGQSSPSSSPCSAPPSFYDTNNTSLRSSISSSSITSDVGAGSNTIRTSVSVNDIKSSRASTSARTRVRKREDEVNDDDNKTWFLSGTAAFTRQTISPAGTDKLGMSSFFLLTHSSLCFGNTHSGIISNITEPLLRYESRGGYAEYIVGNLPIVISVPHGGYLRPLQIPERLGKDVCSTSDIFTQELGRAILQQFYERLHGRIPHMIINRLDRSRLDANRPIDEAAQVHAHLMSYMTSLLVSL
jgi:hypothetical protein